MPISARFKRLSLLIAGLALAACGGTNESAPIADPGQLVAEDCIPNVVRLDASNWHRCENGQRWLREQAGRVELDVPAGTTAITLTGRVLGDRLISISNEGETLIPDAKITPAMPTSIILNETRPAGPLVLDLTFSGPAPFSPKSIDRNEDQRNLVFLLMGVEFSNAIEPTEIETAE